MACPNTLLVSITAAAALIADGLDDEELTLLSAVLTQLGDSLATLAAAKGLCEARSGRSGNAQEN